MLSSQAVEAGREICSQEIHPQSRPNRPERGSKMAQMQRAAERPIRIPELFLLLGCMMIVVLIVYWIREMF